MRRWLGHLLLLTALFGLRVPGAKAQDLPVDVAGGWHPTAAEAASEIPEAPSGFATEQRGPVRWDYPANLRDEMEALADTYHDNWDRIIEEMGGHVDGPLRVRIARNPGEMAKLAPKHAPPPAYAVGVAYPRHGLILLTLTAPDSWERPPMAGVFTHELSHIALCRAVGGNPIPRWFSEGVATMQAGEVSFDRHEQLLRAAFGRTLIPLRDLSANFPNRAYEVNLAYAESASFIAYLRKEPHDARRFDILIARLRDGMPFDDAAREAYGASLAYMEREWHGDLRQSYRVLPIVLGGSALWVLATILMALAYVKRRRQARARLAAWAEEERREEALRAQRLEEASAVRIEHAFFEEARPRPQAPELPHFVEMGRERRDSALPTVEHDGKHHTLH